MRVFILAAGLGTRIRAMFPDIPKPLIPIGGKPFLEWQIVYLHDQGFKDFVVCVSYLGDKIQEHFGNGGAWGVSINYSVEERPEGTGSTLRVAAPFFSGTALVLNGDTYLPIDYLRFVDEHQRHAAAGHTTGTIALADAEGHANSGNVLIDTEGRITAFVEKDSTNADNRLVNAGAYVLEKDVLGFIPAGSASLEHDVFPLLAAQGRLRGFAAKSTFIDVGTPEGYASLERSLS